MVRINCKEDHVKTITFNFVEVPFGTYADRSSYPSEGVFFFIDGKPEIEGSSRWTGVALVEGEDVQYALLEVVSNWGVLKDYLEKEVKEPSPDEEKEIRVDAPRLVARLNAYGEQCTHSFNDILRALAAATGTLPSEVSHDRRI